MPLKSWTFSVGDRTFRTEIWWRFTGWYRKRLFVDHRRVLGVRGRFDMHRSLHASDSPLGPMVVTFTPRRLGFEISQAQTQSACPAIAVARPVKLCTLSFRPQQCTNSPR